MNYIKLHTSLSTDVEFHLSFRSKYMFVSIAGFCLFLTKRSSAVNAYNCRSFSYGCPNSSYFSNLLYGRKRTLILNTIIASGKNQSVALVDMICMI